MKIIVLSLAIVFTLTYCGIALAEKPLPNDLQRYFNETFGSNSGLSAEVYYQSNMTVILEGEALTPLWYNVDNASDLPKTPYVASLDDLEKNPVLWHAVDLVKQEFGYSLDKVVIAGEGTEANPERFYVIMTKQ